MHTLGMGDDSKSQSRFKLANGIFVIPFQMHNHVHLCVYVSVKTPRAFYQSGGKCLYANCGGGITGLLIPQSEATARS